MNTFGTLFRIHFFGESHGACVGLTIDGCPPGLPMAVEDFMEDIRRRQGGTRTGTTPRKESDEPICKSGIFNGYTTGAPLTIIFENNNIRSSDYAKQRAVPRPSHADFVANRKFEGYEDFRGGGHFSGRLTLLIVAAGVVAKKLLGTAQPKAKLIEVGGESDIEAGLDKAIRAKDSVGGIIECCVEHVPLGLGEPFFLSAESAISALIFSIPAVRGIEFGTGFEAARMFGSQHNDSIIDNEGHTATNHCGGIVGGITNGNPLVFRVAIKPTASTPQVQKSLNWETDAVEEFSIKGRHDLCIALRAVVVVEAASAIALLDLLWLFQKASHKSHT